MAARNKPGSLGQVAYAADASADSQEYSPRNGASTVTLIAVPTTAGEARVFLKEPGNDTPIALGTDVVEAPAADATIMKVNFAPEGLGTYFLRFTDLSSTPGVVNFRASDDAK